MKKRSIPDAAKADWSNTGSFMNKPKHGWCHTDGEIARGVTYQALVICIQFFKNCEDTFCKIKFMKLSLIYKM